MADYIEKHGWCQHLGTMPDGRVCIMGAVIKTLHVDATENIPQLAALYKLQNEAELLLLQYLGIRRNTCGVATWNDRFWRTKKQVLRALRRAGKIK